MKGQNPKILAALRKAMSRGPITIREVAEANGSDPRRGDWHRALNYLKATEIVHRSGTLYWIEGASFHVEVSEETVCAVCRHLESTADARLAALLADQAAVREHLRCAKSLQERQKRGAEDRRARTTFNGGISARTPIVFGKEFDETLPKVAGGGVG